MKQHRCNHPGFGRRFLAFLDIFGSGFADWLCDAGIFVQKVGNVLKFEHFWHKKVASDDKVIIVPSFTKAKSKHPIWDVAMENVRKLGDDGTVLEFGTNNGGSLLYFWKNLPTSYVLHGFDSFEGIPEPWDRLPKGAIKGHGYPSELWSAAPEMLPDIERQVAETGVIPLPPQTNIVIHKGLFAHTLPDVMVGGIPKNIRFIHFDADIYMGTRPVLDAICGQMHHKYFILFDELYSVNHEFKAWMEFVEYFGVEQWKVVAISEDGVQTLIEVN